MKDLDQYRMSLGGWWLVLEQGGGGGCCFFLGFVAFRKEKTLCPFGFLSS
jgi:hypothetical protein